MKSQEGKGSPGSAVTANRSDRMSSAPSKGNAPFAVARAEGVYLITPDGRRVLDAAGGAIAVNIGHGRSEVAEVAARSLIELTYAVPPFITEARERLAERLTDRWLPGGLAPVGFASGGSESVEYAIRLARQHHVAAGRPKRWKMIGSDLSYHGATLAGLSVGGHATRRKGLEPLFLDFPKLPTHYCLECSLGRTTEDCRDGAAAKLEEIIEREDPETIAGFIAEPIIGTSGCAVVPPDGYWPQVAEICRKYGVLLIADEVMTGFGRTGERFGVDHWNIVPDVMVGSKGLAAGYAPISGIYATQDVIAPLTERGDSVMFYTYGGHPPACAVADKVLEIIEREDLVARAAKMGEVLRTGLTALADHPNVAEVRGLGLMQGIELVSDRETLEPFPASERFAQKVSAAGLERGVFMYPCGSGRPPRTGHEWTLEEAKRPTAAAQDAILLGPPFTISEEEINSLVGVLEESINAARG